MVERIGGAMEGKRPIDCVLPRLKNSKRYMSNVYYSKLASDEFENDDYGVLDTYNAYVDFVNTYHIENKLTDKNFDEKSFIYYVFESCQCNCKSHIKFCQLASIKQQLISEI